MLLTYMLEINRPPLKNIYLNDVFSFKFLTSRNMVVMRKNYETYIYGLYVYKHKIMNYGISLLCIWFSISVELVKFGTIYKHKLF